MTGRSVFGLLALLLLLTGGGFLARAADAAGPWRGQVVDGESGQPLEGVIVVAVWDKVSPGAMHPARDFHDALEVVTDAEGRFVIPARSVTTMNPFVNFEARSLTFFKSAYALSKVRNVRRFAGRDAVWALMERDGAIFELRRVTTKQEQIRQLSMTPEEVPDALIPGYVAAIKQERARLGLAP